MVDETLAGLLADRFEEFGLRFAEPLDLTTLPEQDTAPVMLLHEQGQAPYRVGFSRSLTSTAREWASHGLGRDRLLLLGPRVTERSAVMFRALGINYMDGAGNAFITFPGVHVDVRGRQVAAAAQRRMGSHRSIRGGVNLFSVKRSQVIFAILAWPALQEAPIREVARQSGVSLGQAQATLELLTQSGFLDECRRLLPHRREQLLDQWVAAYPLGLGGPAETKRFSARSTQVAPLSMPVYISGEAAVPTLLRPETAVLYTAKFPTELIRAHRWRRDDESPNIFLRHQFWPTPEGVSTPGVHEAPPLLVYADLLASKDSRQREAAEQLRETWR